MPAVNAIIQENLLPGNPQSEWDVVNGGDSSIEGFATDISVDQGQTVQFKINTDATNYQIDVYRMGYYGGLGARKVATIQKQLAQPQIQPDPNYDASTGLLDAGTWNVSASWTVPTNATSGIYFAKLVRQDTGAANHIFFVVRDDDGQSDMLFQTSDTTWQAYNAWGGNSLYQGSPDGRAYKLSYNRPFNTRTIPGGSGQTNFVFWAEYPMVRWLESNGYNVSYFTNVDTDRRGAELLEHKVFLSVGHDEYWSGPQFDNVMAARDAGVNLAFFSGNEVFWKIRWETSIDGSGTPYRTLVCYKETKADAKIDPVPDVWTGTFRDPRFSPPADGGRPENSLTGTMFTVNRGPGGIPGTSIQVPEADGKMRFWRNTSVATLQPGEVAVLSNGTLGYEWDEDVDNGHRPAGLIRLSTTTEIVPEHLIDYGYTYVPESATHHLTLYRAASGALVLGTGTVQWAFGLDGNHDGTPSAPDVRMQQATVNVFADMGVQAGALRPGLIQTSASTDFVAPNTTITSLTNGLVIQSGAPLTISGTATDTGGGVVGGVEVSLDGGLSWHPAIGRGSWTYAGSTAIPGSYSILARATDDSLNLETSWANVNVTVVPDNSTAPAISNIVTNLINNQTVTIAWQTDETSTSQVIFGTSPSSLNQSATNSAMVTSHSMTLNNLTPNTTYYYRVLSTDEFNNTSTSPAAPQAPQSFSTPAFSDTTTADFLTGTFGAGTYLALADNGEVTLAPTVGSEFSGTTLLDGWSVVSTRAGGSVVVANGAATLDGATQGNAFFGPGRSLEAVATFSGDPFQAIGFDTDFDQGSRAIFSTFAGGNLYARSKGASAVDTLIPGNWLGAAHKFRIDWTPTSVEYWIDGTRLVVHPLSILNSMRPTASDYQTGGGALVVDSMHLTPYAAAGTYTSRILDGGAAVFWSAIDWLSESPAGTNLDVQVRMGNTSVPDAGWTDWISIASGSTIGGTSRYLQYQANLTSSDATQTPVLKTVTVSYNTGQADNRAPILVSQSPGPASLGISPVAPIVVKFNELMDPASFTGTSIVVRKVGDASDVPAALTFQGAVATLQPTASLFPNAVYQVTLAGSVRDAAGNLLGSDVNWTFTTGWQTLVNLTFGGDTSGGTAAGGDVTLASAASADFSGLTLPVGWSSTLWQGNGAVTVDNGIASIEGARLGPDTLFGPGRSLEFQATFNGSPWQHIGLSLDFSNPPYAIFSSYIGGALYARTSGSSNADTLIPGNWFGTSHLYRIDWNSSSIDYYIDGSLVVSHPITVTGSLRPIASDFNVDNNPLQVDWMRLGPYTPTGTYLSGIYDAGSTVTWSDASWSSVVPVGTSLAISVRMGNTPNPDSSWTSFVPLAGSGAVIGGVSRYLQYRADLTATVAGLTPLLQDVVINYAASTGGLLGGGIHDSTPPTIATSFPAAGAANVSRTATVSIGFSELINPATIDAGHVRLRALGSTQDVTAMVMFMGSTATLQPMQPLAANTVYEVTVSGSIADVVGNSMGSEVTWTFATEALTYVDATATDFNAGVPDANIYVTQIGNGELMLAPTTGSEFSGIALPPNWSASAWNPGGGATVGNGVLSVDGGRVGPDVLYSPGRSLEFVATFSGDAYQHIGLSVDLNSVPYAIFSTGPGGALYARTSGSATMDTTIAGNWLGAPHRFRIDWNSSSIDYFIDDALVASHAVIVSGSLRPLASDYNVNGSMLAIDWLHLGPQADAGTFLSRIIDAGAVAAWSSASWTAATPANTSIAVSVRMGNTPIPDLSWTDFIPLAGSGATIGGASRYFQYRTNLTSSVANVSPVFQDLTIAGDTQPDAIAPAVIFVGPAANATEVNTASSVSVRFSELMDAATINMASFRLRAQGATTDEPAMVSYTGSTATLQPAAALAGNTTYQVTLAATITDSSGNPLGSDTTWSFTTQATGQTTIADTDIADFLTGAASNVYITATGGGQLTLAPAAGAEFTGAALPAGWSSAAWNPGGSANVGGGVVTVEGSRIGPDALFGPGRSLEFQATFGGSAWQHAGFSFDFSNPPYALFSSYSGGGLYARTSGSSNMDTLIPGNWFGAPHLFRIDWNMNSIVYSIDGTQVANHPVTVTGSLRPLVSDYNIDGNALVLDWMRLGPIAASGSFVSRTLDAGIPVTWSSVAWTGTTPTGTSIGVSVRMGNTPFPDASWTDFIPLTSSGAVIGGKSQYLQYRTELASTIAGVTPALHDVSLTYSLGDDAIAPHIVSQTPASGAVGVGLVAPITLKFSELMNLASVSRSSFHVRAVGGTTDVPAIVSISGSTAVLRPTIALAGYTNYEVILDAAITDSSGNALGSGLSWSFETGIGLWQQDTAANFNSGILNGVVVSQEEDGELQLASVFSDDFNNLLLGSSWTNQSWASSGGGPETIAISNGALSLAGTAVYSAQSFQNVPIEGRVQFAAAPWQHFGLATSLDSFAGNYWAKFSTAGTSNRLYARVNVSGSTQDVDLGVLPSGYHVYKIDPTGGQFRFYVDGELRTTIAMSFPTGTATKIALSSYNGSTALQADSVKVLSYALSGTFTSAVFDATRLADWGIMSFTADLPAGCQIIVETRSGDTMLLGGSGTEIIVGDGTGDNLVGGFGNDWSDWTQVANGGQIASPSAQYLQYRVTLITTDPSLTPVLRDIMFSWT